MTHRIRSALKSDISEIVKVYNSNHKFLINHLGMDQFDDTFIFRLSCWQLHTRGTVLKSIKCLKKTCWKLESRLFDLARVIADKNISKT